MDRNTAPELDYRRLTVEASVALSIVLLIVSYFLDGLAGEILPAYALGIGTGALVFYLATEVGLFPR